MKKAIAMIALVAMTLGLAACGADKTDFNDPARYNKGA